MFDPNYIVIAGSYCTALLRVKSWAYQQMWSEMHNLLNINVQIQIGLVLIIGELMLFRTEYYACAPTLSRGHIICVNLQSEAATGHGFQRTSSSQS
jgi:hypothetical protein